MANRVLTSVMTAAAVAAVLLLAPDQAASQNAPGGGARRAANVRRVPPTAPYNAPKTPDGQPNMQGIWEPDAPAASHSLEEGPEPDNSRGRGRTQEQVDEELRTRISLILDPTPSGRLPYRVPALMDQRQMLADIKTPTKETHIEPEDRCMLMGVPRSNYRFDFQILQSPGLVTILYEWTHAYRVIRLDGGPHPASTLKQFNGDSRGRWEGNTLVVDVTNLNGETWFDAHGTHHSDALHVVERWTVGDANTLYYEATVEDSNVFTRPWKVAFAIDRSKDKGHELLEEACYEGNPPTLHEMVNIGQMLKAQGVTGIHEHSPGFYDQSR